MKLPPFFDLGSIEEDNRIKIIGETVTKLGSTVGFILEKDEEKVRRYTGKLLLRFPGVKIISRTDGPTKGTVLIKVGPKSENN